MNKKSVVISSVVISILIMGVIGTTYAYFKSSVSNGSSTPTSVKANTISGLTFNAGKNISLIATQTNMVSGASDLSDTTEATVTLKSRSDASDNYNYKTCLNITENTFVHSAVSSTETSYGMTKNLFDISKVKSASSGSILTNNGDGTLSCKRASDNSSCAALSPNKLSDYCPTCEVGKTYTLSAQVNNADPNSTSSINKKQIYLADLSEAWTFGSRITLTQTHLDSTVYFYGNSPYDGTSVIISDIQIEEGTTATSYDQYGYITSPELVLTVTKNGTTVLTQDIASTSGEICVPTTSGGATLTHNISESANATTTDTWKATITFKNLSANQNANTDKTFNANFVFTKDRNLQSQKIFANYYKKT